MIQQQAPLQNNNPRAQDFSEQLRSWPPELVDRRLYGVDTGEVRRELKKPSRSPETLLRLLSPAAEPYLETMAQEAALLTRQRFGHAMQFYAPLYVSNYCRNACRYCGFNCNTHVFRSSLSQQEALQEADYLAKQGFRHLLLVSGEDPEHVPVEYFAQLATKLRSRFASISVEIYPLRQHEYARLISAGVDGLTLYQETYDPDVYLVMHPAGPKKDFHNRLAAVEKGARAGMHRLGIGALLGLRDWRAEAFWTGLHALYLQRQYWRCRLSISFPRMRKAPGSIDPPCPVDDKAIVQMLCALRIVLPDADMVLSTRESPQFRDNILPLGVTRISAASRTNPGGYTFQEDTSGQFEVQDTRSLQHMIRTVYQKGFEPVLKDWDQALQTQQLQ